MPGLKLNHVSKMGSLCVILNPDQGCIISIKRYWLIVHLALYSRCIDCYQFISLTYKKCWELFTETRFDQLTISDFVHLHCLMSHLYDISSQHQPGKICPEKYRSANIIKSTLWSVHIIHILWKEKASDNTFVMVGILVKKKSWLFAGM